MCQLSVAAKHIDDLMHVKLFHVVAGWSEVFARVKLCRFLCQGLADGRCHGETTVAVDVDLAHCRLRCLAELFLRDAHRCLQSAAVFVDDVDIGLWHPS